MYSDPHFYLDGGENLSPVLAPTETLNGDSLLLLSESGKDGPHEKVNLLKCNVDANSITNLILYHVHVN